PLAGDALATGQKSTTGKPSKGQERFVGIPQVPRQFAHDLHDLCALAPGLDGSASRSDAR
ncbi:MAG TPA: hypothetical protein DDY14_13960, partial [Chromatiaceae bacterium]|nr:hypothetical protein [Chromatiaceae bacterium]